MGDVCEDVSSSIEERKDALSEKHEHHRNSEPRRDEAELHLSDAAELGVEDYVVRYLAKILKRN